MVSTFSSSSLITLLSCKSRLCLSFCKSHLSFFCCNPSLSGSLSTFFISLTILLQRYICSHLVVLSHLLSELSATSFFLQCSPFNLWLCLNLFSLLNDEIHPTYYHLMLPCHILPRGKMWLRFLPSFLLRREGSQAAHSQLTCVHRIVHLCAPSSTLICIFVLLHFTYATPSHHLCSLQVHVLWSLLQPPVSHPREHTIQFQM